MRPEDAAFSHWRRRSLEGFVALRLGFSCIHGLSRTHGDAIVKARADGTFRSLGDFAKRSGLPRHILARLAAAGALAGFGLQRREALWKVHALVTREGDLFAGRDVEEAPVRFDEGRRLERVAQDYRLLGLSAESHPLALLRKRLDSERILRSDRLDRIAGGRRVRVGGMVIIRQRPGTAHGIVFITLEDESGFVNLVVMPDVWERERVAVSGSLFLGAEGEVQRSGKAVTVKVSRLFALSFSENPIEAPASRDFH